MNAFVINEDQIKTAGFVLLAVIVVSFLSGYFLGVSVSTSVNNEMQQVKKGGVSNVSEAVAIKPVINNVVESKNKDSEKIDKKNKSQNKKDKKIDKKEIKKKKEDKKVSAKNKTPKKPEAKKTAEKKKPKKVEKKKTVTNQVVSNKKSQEKKAQNKKKDAKQNAVSEKEKNKETKETKAKKSEVSAKDKTKKLTDPKSDIAQTNERMYSIQAGMFTSETNANSFIEKLAAKEFNAYLSGFVSSSGATKYNVRVGKFKQRDQAREVLKDFQKAFSSPAYVVIAK
ncbi:hypothetical protein MNBD_GAMMA08-2129 [hydrothermal vent metagenome]|uniref:SPOR domain-containing protein n=1 Tax=hydrothermal vent metagenome TaxID=652676 RepID=A0A3B0XYZ0_9ZZZZ